MPRIARQSFIGKYFHIMVQGIAKDFIFEESEYKKKYIKLMYEYKDKFNIEILAYCIMDNHAHLLLHINNIEEMSKFMKQINTVYAMYYNKELNNRVGHVFRNRYKSQEITDNRYLYNCFTYIYNNPVKAGIVENANKYEYSNYNEYLNRKMKNINDNVMFDMELESDIKEMPIEGKFIDIENNEDDFLNEIKEYIINHVDIDKITADYKIKIITDIKKLFGISYKKSCKVFELNERTFRRKMTVLMNVPKADKEEKNEV